MEQVRARHILVESLQDAMDLYIKVKNNGEDFGALARVYSKCPSKQNGGDLGLFGRGQMVKPFEDASFSLPVGGLSEPIQTQFGYHLIQRVE
jgi:peptidyl-prolyl cis-trans isomerase C